MNIFTRCRIGLINSIFLIFLSFTLQGQQADLSLDGTMDCNSDTYCVSISIAASANTFEIGTSSIFLDYNPAALSFDSYTSSAFDGSDLCQFFVLPNGDTIQNIGAAWDPHAFDGSSVPGNFNLTMTLINNDFSCPTVGATPSEIGVLCFSVLDNTLDPAISFIAANTQFNSAIPNDGTNPIPDGTFESINGVEAFNCDPCANLGGDSDNDGVCDDNDQCPGLDDSIIGTACDDGDPCTTGETYDNNCGCTGGVVQDADNDGVCDANDQCPNFDDNLIGTACDDGDPCTTGETYDNNCGCSGGVVQDADNDGVCDANDQCPNFDNNLIGTTCDDNNACTTNDVYTANCNCEGTPVQDSDNDGVCDAEDLCPNFDDNLIGTACDDGDPCTTGETYDNNCGCSGGTIADADNDGVCDANDQCPNFDDNLIGTACDDGNACTTGETYDNNCGCSGGVIQDADNDGVCDADDQCPNFDDNLIGTACDDGNACTTGETYDNNCGCSGGTIADADNDGVCDAEDQCPGADDALIGTACDDGDPCTVGETYDATCGCSGGSLLDNNNNGQCDLNEQNYSSLVINEINYNPSAGDEDEFIEIVNTSANAINLQGVTFSSGVTYTFNNGVTIAGSGSYPANYIVVAKDSLQFITTYGFSPIGEYSGKLSNGGEEITLQDPSGNVIDNVNYDDVLPWDTIPDLGEYSLALLDLTFDNSIATNWKAQNQFFTPGAVNSFEQVGDADGDGVPDDQDQCPGFDDNLIGTACDDGDPCTVGETYDNSCGCSGGTLVDNNNDNVCDYSQEDYSALVINEIHYNPTSGDEGEFVEIVNTGSTAINLDAVSVGGISYTFPQNITIPAADLYPQNYIVLAKDSMAFLTAYGFSPAGEYSGKLSNGGETVNIEDPLGNLIDEVDYDDALPWDTIPDLGEYSLALTDLSADNSLAESWKAQDQFVTPGAINTFAPVTDSDGDGVPDDQDQCPGFDDNLIGTACDDGDPCTVGETYDNSCGCSGGTLVDNNNDNVCDYSQEDYSALVINEIHYNPTSGDEGEFVEIVNTGSTAINLDAVSVGGISYTFAQNISIPASDLYPQNYIVLAKDSMAFLTAYGFSPIGEYSGKLGNGGEILTIEDPLGNLIDEVDYDDESPWDTIPDLGEYSLALTDLAADNSLAENWKAQDQFVTPGAVNSFAPVNGDSDGDGVPDDQDQCPGFDDNLIGTACDDGNPCTTGETYDNDCGCSGGTVADADNDGVCDADDQCPNFDDNLIGTACDDGNPCTTGEIYDANCGCSGGVIADADNDGICDADDQCPNLDDNLIGTACDDGNPCTTGETYDNDCGCSGGTIADADNDGVCDADDQCPNFDDNLIGTACDDGNPCTTGETYDANCGCSGGAIADADNDGVCDADDQCPNFDDNLIGTACDDGDPCTTGETYDANCGCSGGALADADNDGVCDVDDQCPGYDDNDPNNPCSGVPGKANITLDGELNCANDTYCVAIQLSSSASFYEIGTSSIFLEYNPSSLSFASYTSTTFDGEDQCQFFVLPAGDTIFNVGTAWDAHIYDGASVLGNFNLTMTLTNNEYSCPTVTQTPVEVGTICFNILDDSIDPDIKVVAENTQFNRALTNDGSDPVEDGTYINISGVDNLDCSNPCVNLGGDSDNDGICDDNDQCPNFDDNLIGTTCDDGDPCTVGETYDADCGCSGGVFQDADNDGVCDAEDQCPDFDNGLIGTACDDGDVCTENDVYTSDCECAGTLTSDADNDGVCDIEDQCPNFDDNLIGTPCDDGDACTTGETYDADCGCSGGTIADADNDGICDAEDQCPNLHNDLIGSVCDDNDPTTYNDIYTENCTCEGTPIVEETVCVKISASLDDVEEHPTTGVVSTASSDVDLTFDDGDGNQIIGLRFNIDVPQGATVSNATIQFTSDETQSEPTTLTIAAQASDNAPAFTGNNLDVTSRTLTDASVNWSPPAWGSIGLSGDDQKTVDISPVINEIVSRPGYAQGNAIVLVITGTGRRTAESYDGSPNQAPELCITYTESIACTIGAPCSDGDPCTTGETYNADCECTGGTIQDADNDGICDADDLCPNFDDNLIGTACDDGDACTTGETYDENCGCSGGTIADADNDGICDADDQCPNLDDNLIGTPCEDGDVCTTGETYDADCGCTGGVVQDADNDGVCDAEDQCPNFDDNLIGTSCDDNDPNTYDDVYTANCTCEGTPIVDETVCVRIATSLDDVEEHPTTGVVSTASGDIDLTFDDGDGNQIVGLRFNIDVPQGANVSEATIQFTSDEAQSEPTSLTIAAQASDDAPAFTGNDNDVTSRTLTDASVNWSPAEWGDVGLSGDDQKTVDISSVINEIVSRPGYAQGNAIVLVITGTGRRTAESFDGSANQAPELCISYSTGPACIVGAPCDDGDACTTGETYNADCECTGGTIQDADNDGVCDADDQCPNFDDALIGTTCDDGDPNTINDVYTENCTCEGTPDNGGGDYTPCDVPTNVALTGTVAQSSTITAAGITGSAEKAIDGNTNGVFFTNPAENSSVSATNNELEPWWQIDLGSMHNIDDIDIYNRTDGVDQTGSIYILISDVPFVSDDLAGAIAEADKSIFEADAPGTPTNYPVEAVGRYVRIQHVGISYLVLAEVQINGCEVDPVDPCEPFVDSDNDGVCDAEDQCPGFDDNLIGTACDDGNACTVGETYDANCGCSGGVVQDADNDGVCDADDQCPNFDDALIGTACDDGDPNTINDMYTSNCICEGTPDNGGGDYTPCDTPINAALNGTATQSSTITAGGISGTANKAIDGNTNGVFFTNPAQNSSVAATNNQLEPWWQIDLGSMHNIDDINIYNRTDGVDQTGSIYILISDVPFVADDLAGAIAEADKVIFEPNAPATPSTYTVEEVGRYVRIQHVGTSYLVLAEVQIIGCDVDGGDPCVPFVDSDGDGVCDALDQCPDFDDSLIGTPCDDGDACTTGETYDENCGCSGGVVQDADDDGICDAEDDCPNDPDNNCNVLDYCESNARSCNHEYIDQVTFEQIDNISGGFDPNAQIVGEIGYTDFTSISTDVTAGQTYDITLKPGFRDEPYLEYWSVWIDFNQDGDFDDPGEQVLTDNSTGTINSTISIPADAATGTTRMRITMQWNAAPSSSCGQFPFGEVEDYNININN